MAKCESAVGYNRGMGDIPRAVPPPSKPPPPWLGPGIAIAALAFSIVFSIVWAYLQMRHWKEPEADYVSIGAIILVTVLLWGALIWAIITTYSFKKLATPEQRPTIKPGIVVGVALFFAVGLSGAWYLAHRHQPSPTAKMTPSPAADNKPAPASAPPKPIPSPVPQASPNGTESGKVVNRKKATASDTAKAKTGETNEPHGKKNRAHEPPSPPDSKPEMPKPGNNCPQGICGDGIIVNPTVNNGPPQKASLELYGINRLRSESCTPRVFEPRSSTDRVEQERREQWLRTLVPQAGDWYCLHLTFVNNGNLPAENPWCATVIVLDLRPTYPPHEDELGKFISEQLYNMNYREHAVNNNVQPGFQVSCDTESIPDEEYRKISSGDNGIFLYAVEKYTYSSLSDNMIGATYIGKYFINTNTFTTSAPGIGKNMVTVTPLK
jgi:hypothetical protein